MDKLGSQLPGLTPARVLLVDLGFLGDAVHLVPALRVLREAYPRAALHAVSTPLGCAVLRLAGGVDRCWEIELHPDRRSVRAQWRLIRDLRAERFDLAFNLSAVDRSILLTRLSGARIRVALLGGRDHFWNRWLIPHWLPRQPEDVPVFQQRLQALKAAGLSAEGSPPRLDPPAAEASWARTHVPSDAIHFSLCASTPLKEWPLEHWVELASSLLGAQPSLRVVVSGSPARREQERVREFLARMDHPRTDRLPTAVSIPQLAAALARCRLHVGPDSGVIHLAAALGVPTVSLFRRRGAPTAWAPSGPTHRTLLAPCDCPEDRRSPCAAAGRARCLEDLRPENVRDAVLGVLAGCRT